MLVARHPPTLNTEKTKTMALNWVNKITVIPDNIRGSTASAVKVVAVAGWDNDWAAYEGPSDWTDEQVAASGSKIDGEVARRLFVSYNESGRRYRS